MTAVSAGRADSDQGSAGRADVVPYLFDTTSIRAGFDGGASWFVLADLAAALGYRDAANARRVLRSDQGSTHVVSTADGNRRVLTVTESGMYRLVLRSTRPEAERFQDWVTDEVLPAIRARGVYATPEVNRELAQGVAAAGLAIDVVMESATARVDAEQRANPTPLEGDRVTEFRETIALRDARHQIRLLERRFPLDGPVLVPDSVAALRGKRGADREITTFDPWAES